MSLLTSSFAANPLTLSMNLQSANEDLAGATAAEVITWALGLAEYPVISTNFRPGSAALLHMVVLARPDIPVIWVDTGYNTPATYRYVDALTRAWKLNLHSYSPRMTAARHAAVSGVIPAPDAANFTAFVRDSKLEPFERAFNELKPDVWFTGIRSEQNELRQALGVVSRGHRNTLRVAPLHAWNSTEVSAYLAAQHIEDNLDYADPTKPQAQLECGLQLLA